MISGENIVGILKAKRTNTADDKIVIVGAHYDTTENTPGVDDNGSGMTALLQIAKQIGKQPRTLNSAHSDSESKKTNCTLSLVTAQIMIAILNTNFSLQQQILNNYYFTFKFHSRSLFVNILQLILNVRQLFGFGR